MSLLQQLIDGAEQTDPRLAQQLRDELAAAGVAPAEPPKPPTILDELRAALNSEDGHGLTVSEVPAAHELPLAVAVLIDFVHDLEQRISDIESSDAVIRDTTPGKVEPAASPADAAPAPDQVPSEPPASAPVAPAAPVPPATANPPFPPADQPPADPTPEPPA